MVSFIFSYIFPFVSCRRSISQKKKHDLFYKAMLLSSLFNYLHFYEEGRMFWESEKYFISIHPWPVQLVPCVKTVPKNTTIRYRIIIFWGGLIKESNSISPLCWLLSYFSGDVSKKRPYSLCKIHGHRVILRSILTHL